jgi:5'-nucleotidase
MESHSIVRSDGREEAPDLRLLHYNDVYHVEAGSREPVGGISRFQTLCNQYQEGSPKLLTLFSGDAFNPSLESSVTKGSPGDLHNGMIQADVMKVHIWCHF